MSRRLIVVLTAALLLGCSDSPEEPTLGFGWLGIQTVTSGPFPDQSLELFVDGRYTRKLGGNETRLIRELEPGAHEIELGSLNFHCTGLDTAAIAQISIGDTTWVTFTVECNGISSLPSDLIFDFHRSQDGSDSRIYRMTSDGASWADLGEGTHAGVSRDGTAIAYLIRRPLCGSVGLHALGWPVPGIPIPHQLYAMDPTGHDVKLLSDLCYCGPPTWSPDGGEVAFSGGDLYQTRLTYAMRVDGTGSQVAFDRAWMGLTWSPVANRFVAADTAQLYILSPDTPDDPELVMPGWTGQGVGYPDWSPDGAKIVFAGLEDWTGVGTPNWEIYVVDAGGGNLTRLTHHEAIDNLPAWSPDGGHIAFMSDRDGDWPDIFVMRADGSMVTNVTDQIDGRKRFPAWLPNP